LFRTGVALHSSADTTLIIRVLLSNGISKNQSAKILIFYGKDTDYLQEKH
jgi:hypothetical protein